MAREAAHPLTLLITCEHAGNRVPSPYRDLFAPHRPLLDSHRGFDPGALPMARYLSKSFGSELLSHDVTRLLVEVNRSEHHRSLFSKVTRTLPPDERLNILAAYYQPHRSRVRHAVQTALRQGNRVAHIGVHSFTPVLDGHERLMDVGLLYDPARRGEKTLCRRWKQALSRIAPDLRVRSNQPYRGTSDGLTKALRQTFPRRYMGIELEINHALLIGPNASPRRIHRIVEQSLRAAIDASI